MLKRAILGMFILLTMIQADAQNVDFGFSADLGNSWNTLKKVSGETYVITPSTGIGIFACKDITDHSRIQLELLWIRMTDKLRIKNIPFIGSNPDVPEGIVDVDETRIINYLSLPVLYGYQIGKINFQIGPQASLYLSGKQKSKVDGIVNEEPYSTIRKKTDDSTNDLDFGIRGAVEYGLTERIQLILNYYHGIVNVQIKDSIFEREQRRMSIGAKYIISKRGV